MEAHGTLKFQWIENILYIEPFGPFNEEGVTIEAGKYLEMVLNREFEKFYIIEVWNNESFASPVSFEKVASLWNMLSDNGCTFLAIVASNDLQKIIASEMIPDIGKIFSNKEDAQKWISENYQN